MCCFVQLESLSPRPDSKHKQRPSSDLINIVNSFINISNFIYLKIDGKTGDQELPFLLK